jgi:nucleoside-diphosphate-sugar epimerase
MGGHPVIKQQRLDQLRSIAQIIPDAPFGSGKFIQVASEGDFDVLCHHGAEVGDYRSPEFDVIGAVTSNTINLPRVIEVINGKPIVVTGSVFEQDEGDGGDFSGAFSPYGVSKGMTWEYFRYFCQTSGVTLGKFVIPNPFGPFEEQRFTAYLMKTWKEGKAAEVKTPDYIRDNIPVDLLAYAYSSFVDRVTSSVQTKGRINFANPSGYIGSQGDFVERISREVRKRTGRACEFIFANQVEFSEPMKRTNTDTQFEKHPKWTEDNFWDQFTCHYL